MAGAGLGLILALAAGCTVQPLYDSSPERTGLGAPAVDLSSVAIDPVSTRYAQEVRNHLIFLLSGGAGEPASPRYALDLTVTRSTTSSVQVQSGSENEPTAGTVTMTGIYRLKDTATGSVVANGRRNVSSSFDRPRQEYAVLRAERDAENRAARELAESLRLAVAQDMARLDKR
nr:LPS assembly lipoprotein LptE [Nitratireductor luteus]